MATRSTPEPANDRDLAIAALEEKVRKLEKINAALIDRVERSTDIQGGAFSMFENAIALEAMVRDRTAELEEAMGQLGAANAASEAAHRDADAARARLRDAIESLSDGFALFDAEDRLLMCNRAFLSFWPEIEEIADSQPRFPEMVERIARSGRPIGSLVSSDRWVRDRLTRHREAGTHVQPLSDGRWLQINELRTREGGTVGIYTDITSVKAEDARQRARELAERNLALQSTLDTLSEGACLFDSKKRLQAWNDGLADMLRLDRELVSRISTHDDFARHCIEERGLDRPQAVEWRGGRSPRISTECMLRDRNFVIRSVTLATGGMAFAFDDVTDRIRFQRSLTETAETLEKAVVERTAELVEVNAQLSDAKEEAERANLSKTRFIAAASHDLLQPLNAARLFVSALGERRLAEGSRGLVSQAGVALDSVEELLEALFEISRLDAGAIQPEIAPLDLDRILSALRIEFAPLAKARGLEFAIEPTGLWVASDVKMLRRILQNFVSNAIRYTSEGAVKVTAERRRDEVIVKVSDTGPGIPQADQARIFEEFKRLDGTRAEPGHGLGLAIVRRMGRRLGHAVSLVSAPGMGATFALALPRAEVATPAPSAGPLRQRRQPRCGAVLVIDNDASILVGMEALLSGWGIAVVTATGPDDPAAQAAVAGRLAMVIADYHLDAGLTGDAAIAALRACHKGELPAAIITADRTDEVKAALAAAGLPVLTKPVKPAQLRALLRQLAVAD